MTETRYDGLLLDHDGVIVTLCSHEVLGRAATDAFVDAGVSDPRPADVETITIRVSEDELCAVADRYGIDPDRLWQCREQRIEQTLRTEVSAGRKAPYEDVPCLDRVPVPIGIVSNNQHETIENVLEYTDVGAFDVWYGREPTLRGIERKKPRPYYLERAIADLEASNPLYVGDSRVDVEAANALGIDAAFVRRDHRLDYALSSEPTYEIESLESLTDLL